MSCGVQLNILHIGHTEHRTVQKNYTTKQSWLLGDKSSSVATGQAMCLSMLERLGNPVVTGDGVTCW